jgi:Domain of unknown function, B. Theta Gene description (DUF3871)
MTYILFLDTNEGSPLALPKINQINNNLIINSTEMEVLQINTDEQIEEIQSSTKPFILANTIGSSLQEIRDQHIIPVFVKDNEPVISQADFINTALDVVTHVFQRATILSPCVRVSHPIKGRIPDAKDKPASLLKEEEKTIYYERMAFSIEIPTITETIDGNQLSLTVGGIKAYNLDNLYNKKGADEHFKIYIGFQNKVCTNLCVWSDGFVGDLKVQNSHQLVDGIFNLVSNYNAQLHLNSLKEFNNYELSEQQFANLIGRCRMYQHLPNQFKANIPELLFGDNQIGMVLKDYYQNKSFCRSNNGDINIWKLYNLLTGANKTSYIDTFLDRSVNAFDFTNAITNALANKESNWFLN